MGVKSQRRRHRVSYRSAHFANGCPQPGSRQSPCPISTPPIIAAIERDNENSPPRLGRIGYKSTGHAEASARLKYNMSAAYMMLLFLRLLLLTVLCCPSCLAMPPSQCLRLFTQPSQNGPWLDVCGDNPNIPGTFASMLGSVGNKRVGDSPHIRFFMLYNGINYSGTEITMSENSFMNLKKGFHLRSVRQMCIHMRRKRPIDCVTGALLDDIW